MRMLTHSVAAHGWRLVVSVVLAAVFVLGIIATPPVSAQSAKDALPPKAEKAMQRGLAAARQQEWELAVKYFGEARVGAPRAPEVLFNLALAYDKAGGAQFLASRWYKAYLASAPNAANAAQVRARVNDLMIKYEANVWELIRKTEEIIALNMNSNDVKRYSHKAGSLYNAMGNVVAAYAFMGKVGEAKRLTKEFQIEYYVEYIEVHHLLYKKGMYMALSLVLAQLGDRAGAEAAWAKSNRAVELEVIHDELEKFDEWQQRLQKTDWQEISEVLDWGQHYSSFFVWIVSRHLTVFDNLPAFWQQIKNKEPVELAKILGETVHHMAAAWAHFQRLESLWTKRRTQAQ